MVYLHPQLQTPDPTIGRQLTMLEDPWYGFSVYPHAIAWASQPEAVSAWGARLHLHQPSPPLTCRVAPDEFDLVLDFGTECEGAFVLEIQADDAGSMAFSFGESSWEAREWGLSVACDIVRPRKTLWRIPAAGRHLFRSEEGGFRFVRIRATEFRQPFVLRAAHVEARFMFKEPLGSFVCSAPLFQRIWQTSVYTARLCSRPDSFWDGIKRDRLGWYGDARITKSTIDAVYFDPAPSIAMLSALESDRWANAIPNFSFDALAMFVSHVLTYGAGDPALRDIYRKVTDFLDWISRTQVGADGSLVRSDSVEYFFGIGFTDWSPQPLGGRFEELACLQFSWLEALRNAARLAHWFGDDARATQYQQHAEQLSALLVSRFWEQGQGFHHTLNVAESPKIPWRMPLSAGEHYQKSYLEGVQCGPSGPSLHANARAVFAGLCTLEQQQVLRERIFGNPGLPPSITSYYQYYINEARATCGDVSGAYAALCRYFGDMLTENDAATIWESYEPEVHDMHRWSLGSFPKSLCHAWGSGSVAITQRHLLGIQVDAPGMAALTLAPQTGVPWAITAAVPTPFGMIEIERAPENGPVHYRVPSGIGIIVPENDLAVTVEHTVAGG